MATHSGPHVELEGGCGGDRWHKAEGPWSVFMSPSSRIEGQNATRSALGTGATAGVFPEDPRPASARTGRVSVHQEIRPRTVGQTQEGVFIETQGRRLTQRRPETCKS